MLATLLAIGAGTAQANDVLATGTCSSVTFRWSQFGSSGSGNGGFNKPHWTVAFKPTGGVTTTTTGVASFSGSSSSLTVPIASLNGVVTASSAWSSSETRDGYSGSTTTSFAISNCVAVVLPPSPPPPVVTVSPVPPVSEDNPVELLRVSMASPEITTNGSSPVPLGGSIHDTAVLSGGNAPTGTIAFTLHWASDTKCSTVLARVTVPVAGNGSYDSPPITPRLAASYQWVASYGGDASNNSVSGTCNTPSERSVVTPPVAHSACVTGPVVLRGVRGKVRRSLSASVLARGVKSATFYLDGRRYVKLTKPRDRRFAVTVDARDLSYGAHRLRVEVQMTDPTCTATAAAAVFIHVRSATRPPTFAG